MEKVKGENACITTCVLFALPSLILGILIFSKQNLEHFWPALRFVNVFANTIFYSIALYRFTKGRGLAGANAMIVAGILSLPLGIVSIVMASRYKKRIRKTLAIASGVEKLRVEGGSSGAGI